MSGFQIADVAIPDRPAFKASEVCGIAHLQPYVLRSWENEFPDLGVSRTQGGPRVYRKADVERVLQIPTLVLSEGLTLSGVRRKLEGAGPTRIRWPRRRPRATVGSQTFVGVWLIGDAYRSVARHPPMALDQEQRLETAMALSDD